MSSVKLKQETLMLIAKFSDNTVRQIMLTSQQRSAIINLLLISGGKVFVSDEPITGIDLISGGNTGTKHDAGQNVRQNDKNSTQAKTLKNNKNE